MNNFYDLNYFFSFTLRKIKLCIVIILICVLGFAGVRFYSVYQEYSESQQQSQSDEPAAKTGEEPIYKIAQTVLYINEPAAAGNDRGEAIASALSKAGYNQEVFDNLSEKYFDQAKESYGKMQNSLLEYGYILDKEKDYPFNMYSFQNMFTTDESKGVVTFSVSSSDAELSEAMAADYSKLVVQMAEKSLGEIDYSQIDGGLQYRLPTATVGSSPTRYKASAGAAAQMSFTNVIKQTVKGLVWGALLGVVLAVLIMFMIYMLSHRITSIAWLRETGCRFYGTIPAARQGIFRKTIRRMCARLEGSNTVFDSTRQAAALIAADAENGTPVKAAVTGSGSSELIRTMTADLQQTAAGSVSFFACDSINNSSESLKNIKAADCAVLVEELGRSYQDMVTQEIAALEEQGVKILGIIAAE